MGRVFFILIFFLFAFIPLKVISCNTDSCNIIKALKLRYEKPDSSILICNYLLNKSEVHDSITHRSCEIMGDAFWHKGEFSSSIENYKLALIHSKKLNNPEIESRANSNLGYLYMEVGDFDQAVEHLNRAADIALKNNLDERYKISMVYLAQVWGSNLQFEKAIAVQKDLLSNINPATDSVSYAIISGNMADNFSRAGKPDSAIHYYKIALKIDEKMGNLKEVSNTCSSLANIYCNMKKYDDALFYILKSIDVQRENDSSSNLTASYAILARIYSGRGDAGNAKKYIDFALEMMKAMKSNRMNAHVYEQAKEVYKNIGDIENAFKYLELYAATNDSVYIEESASKMAQMQTRLEVSGKEKEIELLNKDKQLQQTQRNLLLVVVLLVVVFAIFIFNRLKVSRKQNKIIQAQKTEVEEAKHIVDEKQKEILDSIYYARRIQRALITNEKYFEKALRSLNKTTKQG